MATEAKPATKECAVEAKAHMVDASVQTEAPEPSHSSNGHPNSEAESKRKQFEARNGYKKPRGGKWVNGPPPAQYHVHNYWPTW